MKHLQQNWHQWHIITLLSLALIIVHQPVRAQATTHKADTTAARPAVNTAERVFTEPAETSPEPYGGMRNFYLFIYQRLAFDNLTDRQRAIAAFVIERDGSLSHISLVRSNMSKNMNAQIIRALYMAPKWQPGTQNGQPIRVQYTIPVTNY